MVWCCTFTSISPSSPSLSTPSHAVSSSACLTCLLLRLDRAVQESEADSQSEEDQMKRRKESGGVANYNTFLPRSISVPPISHLSSPLLLSLVSCLALLMGSLFGFDIQDVRAVECNVRALGRNCSHLYVILLKHQTFH